MSKALLYKALKRQILTLELAPGAPLDETRLSEHYQLSRTPLREVFRQLQGEGYLQLLPNRGAMVASMDHTTMRHFFMSAPMIYAAIGQLAAQNQIGGIKAITEAQAHFKQAVQAGNSADMVYWNDQFHRIMGDMSGNHYLRPSYERLLIDHARISQTFYQSPGEALDKAVADHDAMIAAIASGAAQDMAALIDGHWSLSRAHMERYIHADPLALSLAVSE